MTASAGSWSGPEPITYAYEWRRCDGGGAGCTAIPGASRQSYTLVSADVGATIRVAVTATNTAGSATATSAETAVVEAARAGSLHSFGSVLVSPAFNLNGDGSNVDSIAFWEAVDPTQSLMFVTSKDAALVEVWRYPYRSSSEQRAALRHSCFGTGTNGVLVDQQADLLYVSPRNTRICVFQLPSLSFVRSFDTNSSGGTSEPNLALLGTAADQGQLYVSYDNVVHIHDAGTGSALGRFAPEKGLETMVADPYSQTLYIPDENGRTGVYEYHPDGAFTGTVFGATVFSSDAEGVAIYECSDGEGIIIVSDQRTSLNDYEVFDRKTKQHLGVVQLEGIANTDGIASTQQSSTAYPGGVFAAIDSDTSVVGVSWEEIFSEISQQTGSTFGCS